jgi:hypothetical protein
VGTHQRYTAVQVTEACKQLTCCVSATAGCVSIAVDTPGALPAVLRLVRCCNRSRPHTALLAASLTALDPMSADAQGELLRRPLHAARMCFLCWSF